MNCRTSCCRKFGLVFVLLALAILAVPAFAQNCLQNEYNLEAGLSATSTAQSNALNCTANDVRVAKVVNIRDPLTGKTLSTCFQGTHFNFLADFEVVTSSTSSRSNIGLYFATNSTTQALTGSCVDNIIQPAHPCPDNTSITCGSDNYKELDTSTPTDNCGDTTSQDNSPVFGIAAQGVTVEVDDFLCQAPAGSSTLVLPNCTSWQIPGGTILCVSPAPDFPYERAATPGTKSKCNCSIISLPITPITVTASITKSCTTSISTQTSPPLTLCDEGAEGLDPATYSVTITPTVSVGDSIVDQICDTAYGTVVDDNLLNSSNQRVFPPCPAGSTGLSITGTGCVAGSDIPNGGSYTCTFTAPAIGELTSVTDQASASLHSKDNTSSTVTTAESNSVKVFSEDAPSSATVTKGFVGTEAACATVRYSVEVDNTSSFDETETLSVLNDSTYGDITKLGSGSPPIVLGTTCGVSAGLGTLSGSTGAGAFPATIATGGKYTCQFDGQFCSALDPNSCLSETDSVTGTLKGDESTDSTFTQKANTLTVQECLKATVTSVP
jgi:hypothetical protein